MEAKKTFRVKIDEVEINEQPLTESPKNDSPSNDGSNSKRFYLPVLNLNNERYWPPKKRTERQFWTDEKAFEVCVGNCCNVPGLKAACCRLDPEDLEHVLGPVTEEDIRKIIVKLSKQGMTVKRSDVVVDFEEGKIIGDKFFGSHKIFNEPTSYPMLRMQLDGPRFTCKFLSPETGKCGIYKFRPAMCEGYLCQYVQNNYMIRTRDKPNTFRKIR